VREFGAVLVCEFEELIINVVENEGLEQKVLAGFGVLDARVEHHLGLVGHVVNEVGVQRLVDFGPGLEVLEEGVEVALEHSLDCLPNLLGAVSQRHLD